MVEHDGCKGCRYEKFRVTSSHCQGCTQNSIDKYIGITNADRIRSMSDEELAKLIAEKIECTECPFNGDEEKCGNNECSRLFLEWLQSEAEG